MAETSSDGGGASPSAAPPLDSLFQRRIEFHPARKPISAISCCGGGGFRLETLNPSSDPPRPPPASPGAAPMAAPGRRSEGPQLYEHGLDPELSFRITFRRIGAGLANLGNTCFLNSVLQCLTYTEPFAAYLQSGKHKSSCQTAGFCAMCALQNHVMTALQSTGKILSPFHLVKNLRCISHTFRNSRQEDAHEYMVNLLESMHKCCLPSGIPSESPSAYERSLVHRIFGGRLRSQVKCMQCKFCSNKFDPFLDLSLEIARADSLRKALLHFTAVEQLDGGEKQYQCQRCKEKVRALKQLTIHKAPHVLTIHLKRFSSHAPSEKIDKKVEFEPTLDLRPFVSDPHEGDMKYSLYGVLVHAGWSTHSGHYYCFVRTSSGMWHSLDDNQVCQVSEKTVLAQKAYMLFYVRDRSSTIKTVSAFHKDNTAANTPGNKFVPHPASLYCALENGKVERKLGTLASTSGSMKPHAIVNSQSSFVSGASTNQPSKEASSVQNNGDIKCVGASSDIQHKSPVLLSKAPNLFANGDNIPTKVKQATPMDHRIPSSLGNSAFIVNSADSTLHQKVAEVLAIETQPKSHCIATSPRKDVHASPKSDTMPTKLKQMSMDHRITSSLGDSDTIVNAANTLHQKVTEQLAQETQPRSQCIATSPRKDDHVRPKSDRLIKDGCQINYGLDASLKSRDPTLQPKSPTFSKDVAGIHDNRIIASTVKPQDDSAASGIALCNQASSEEIKKVLSEPLNQSGPIQDASAITAGEHQMFGPNLPPESVECQNDTEYNTKPDEARLSYVVKKQKSTNYSIMEKVIAESVTAYACNQVDLKPKKLVKRAAKSICFGRKQLFLTSLRLHRSKKRNRAKRKLLALKDMERHGVLNDLRMSDQQASSSEAGHVDMSSNCRQRKRSHSTSNEVSVHAVNNGSYCTGDSRDITIEKTSERNHNGSSAYTVPEKPKMSSNSTIKQWNTKDTDTNGRAPRQNGFMSLLTRGLAEIAVARWDDVDLPQTKLAEVGGSTRTSIGYVLDEWDEEYDRGRRKKVKKSREQFDGSNPFQDTANMQAQQKMRLKVDQTRLGNQPLRI